MIEIDMLWFNLKTENYYNCLYEYIGIMHITILPFMYYAQFKIN